MSNNLGLISAASLHESAQFTRDEAKVVGNSKQ
jgi:hypothetical protein